MIYCYYVIYYLSALREVCDKIIFVSDSDLPENEKNKLSFFCDFVQAYHHGQYDWGSYKFGYIIAKQNNLLQNNLKLYLILRRLWLSWTFATFFRNKT